MSRGQSRKFLAGKFCRCIKKVKKTVKVRKGTARGNRGNRGNRGKESAAIAICVKSVLGTRGRTLRKFRCTTKPRRLQTQDPSNVKRAD